MENFTPIPSLLGGLCIGLSAAMLLLMNGRIAGISGILGGLVPPARGDAAWRILFLVGLSLGALAWRYAAADGHTITIDASLPVLVVGGLLVGFGTRLGGGCTSGHGVCGIGRLSPSSIVATVAFMATGALTVFVVRHLIGG